MERSIIEKWIFQPTKNRDGHVLLRFDEWVNSCPHTYRSCSATSFLVTLSHTLWSGDASSMKTTSSPNLNETADVQLPEKQRSRRMMRHTIHYIADLLANLQQICLSEWEKKPGRPYVSFGAHVATTVSFHHRKRLNKTFFVKSGMTGWFVVISGPIIALLLGRPLRGVLGLDYWTRWQSSCVCANPWVYLSLRSICPSDVGQKQCQQRLVEWNTSLPLQSKHTFNLIY